ncbi:MAG TPA: response regulator transcription factor [Syntrophorhabdaceae bacterium]|nr:response regulator transcription factor [Syntrophorhabdaceae bacterium]
MIKIIIADDHPVVRKGLKQILSEETDVELVKEARNDSEVLNLLHAHDWDAVVLDITMPGRGGLELLTELKRLRPKLPVLVLTVHPEDQYAVRALKEGASGYMNKESAPEELVQAIRKIIRGGKYVSAALAEKLASMIGAEAQPHENLSIREYQVMLLIASGKTVSEIAEEMSLSIKTISTYRTRILEKMGMTNNVELARYAMKHNLIQ